MSGMKSWSTTAASNVLANTGFTMDEGMAPSALNDSIRQLMADVRTEWAQGADIASATTTDLSAATGGYVHVTGTTTITGLGTCSAGIRRVVEFDGALTLTHNATSLILPGGANITTVAKDTATFISLGSGNWKCVSYNPYTVTGTGSAVRAASPTFTGTVNVAALTASGVIKSTNADGFLLQPTTGTSYGTYEVTNTGGTLFIGLDSSTGSAFGTAGNYGTVIYRPTSTAFAISRGATIDLYLSATGALTLITPPAFSAGCKYLVIDASGNVKISALGPAS